MSRTILVAMLAILAGSIAHSVAHAYQGPLLESEANEDLTRRQDMWSIDIRDGEIDFLLREQDLDSDFVVFRSADRGGLAWQLIRWVKQDGKILLRSVSERREELLPDWNTAAVTAHEFPAIREADGKYRIRTTALFGQAFPSGWGFPHADADARIITFGTVKIFPRNAVIRTEYQGDNLVERSGARWNFIKLPEKKMGIRRLHGRTAFKHPQWWQSNLNRKLETEPYEVLQRRRLEDAGQDGRVGASPILIHVDPNTPQRWRRWVAAGIESWQQAFEKIGYRQAMRAVLPDDASTLDYEDIRYSVLCWKSRKLGCDGNVFDPRTGEILQFHMGGQDFVLEVLLARYVVALAAVDDRVLEAPLPDTLLGSFIQRVSTHEVGHMLGLKDGTYGTFTYAPEQLRDPAWVAENSFTPSVMNYARFNYLAQPEDGMPVASLMALNPGPADHFWIRLGYGRDSEETIENLWNSNPLYRYRTPSSDPLDPYDGSETPGVADPVAGARLGMLNLERSMDLLGHHVFQENDPEIAEFLSARSLHAAALTQWFQMHQQVLSLVGGRLVSADENSRGELSLFEESGRKPGRVAVSAEKQKEAVRFVCESFFASTPDFLLNGPLVRAAGLDREAAMQLIAKKRDQMFLQRLATSRRLNRLIELNGTFPGEKGSYGIVNLMRDLQGCVVRQ